MIQFEVQLKGYILDEEDFEVIPAINRAFIVEEIADDIEIPRVKIKADKDENVVNGPDPLIVGSPKQILSKDIELDEWP